MRETPAHGPVHRDAHFTSANRQVQKGVDDSRSPAADLAKLSERGDRVRGLRAACPEHQPPGERALVRCVQSGQTGRARGARAVGRSLCGQGWHLHASSDRLRGYDLTLIESEVLDRLMLPDGSQLAAAESRRNLVTRGIDLNALVGREFTIGSVRAFGQRLCEPCVHLQRLTRPGVVAGLVRRGGLRADILTDGEIRLGDTIAAGARSTS